MNRQSVSLLCLILLATLPACRKQRKEEKKQQEEVNTMIEINDIIEEEKTETKKSIIKF